MTPRHAIFASAGSAVLVAGLYGCGGDAPAAPVLRTDDGSRIAFVTRRDGDMEIFTMSPSGTDYVQVTMNYVRDDDPGWSPDRSKIAYTMEVEGNWEVFVRDADGGGTPVRLTENFPHWEGDVKFDHAGDRLLFSSDRNSPATLDIYIMRADGTGAYPVASHPAWDANPDWSPDGADVVFQSRRDGDWDIYVSDAENAGSVRRLTRDQGRNFDPAWSPDGSKIAFASDRSGTFDVWVMNPDGSDQVRLTTLGGEEPSWSPDGAGIAFSSVRDGNWEIYVMNADGSNQTNLTNNPFTDEEPDWSR